MRKCRLCGKGSKMGGARKLLRGHYNPVNWSRKYPNLQHSKVDGKRMLICTSCMRTRAKAVKSPSTSLPSMRLGTSRTSK